MLATITIINYCNCVTLPWLQKRPPQPVLHLHCMGFKQNPLSQPGNTIHCEQSLPVHPNAQLKNDKKTTLKFVARVNSEFFRIQIEVRKPVDWLCKNQVFA